MNPVPGPILDATATRRGLMGVVAQTLAGIKTFLDPLRLARRTTAQLPVGGAELEAAIAYDTTTKRPQFHDGVSWVPLAAVVGSGGASLAEHISNTEAHPASSVTLPPAVFPLWADETRVEETKVQAALVRMVEDLAFPGGAGKIGADPGGGLTGLTVQEQLDELRSIKQDELQSDSVWTDISSSVNTLSGWATTGGPIYAIRLGDKLLLKGRVRRATGNTANTLFMTMPNQYLVGRYQAQTIVCTIDTGTVYYSLLVGGGVNALPGVNLLNEASLPAHGEIEVILDGLEFYFY